MGKMFVNIVHRADSGSILLEGLQFQQSLAYELGLKSTLLVSYEALTDGNMIAYVREQAKRSDVEIGMHFHNMWCSDLTQRFGTNEHLFFLMPFELKKKIINYFFSRFIETFGFIPKAIGGYILDAEVMTYIKENYPSVSAAITNCFEEGIHMFEGNNHGWPLFCEGGPWGAYYPSRDNILCPAGCPEDSIGIVGLPHLNRDMLLSITSRDDYFSSHALNLARGKVNEGGECPYMFSFIDQWIRQADYNGYAYYNVFVSTPWILDRKGMSEHTEYARKLYRDSLAYLKGKIDDGLAESMTMSEFAEWFMSNVDYGRPEVNLWNDILCGSRRQIFWYIDPHMRAAVDLNAGGSICDLRPYAGRLKRNLGPDKSNLYDGSYPFVVSTDHRGGIELGSIHTCKLAYGSSSMAISDYRTKAALELLEDGSRVLKVEPLKITLGEIQVVLESTYTFKGDGGLVIDRLVRDISDEGARITITECHKGTWGSTPYAPDMKGIKLEISDSGSIKQQMDYSYQSRSLKMEHPGYISAEIPQMDVRTIFRPENGADSGEITEGFLSMPLYTLALNKALGKGEVLRTCLYMEKI